jgi:hypothetical protein
MGDADVPGLRQERRSPVENGITQSVHKKIREGNQPDVFVAEHLLDQEGMEFAAGICF